MGNHHVGYSMGRSAEIWWLARGVASDPTKDEALAALDTVCKPYRGADAEFETEHPHPDYEDYTDPKGPLGRLIAIAFEATPDEIADEQTEDECPWYDGPYTRFKERYRFC